jgi:ADP-heptose:LPS heptosyltransferase
VAVTALVLRALGLGDLLTAVPALRALRRAGLRTVLAAPAWLGEVAALTGAVDRLLPTAGLGRIAWRGPVELAVNLHGKGPISHEQLLALGPRRLWAYAHPAVPVAGPGWDEDEHEVARWCRLLAWYGLRPDPEDLALPVPPGPRPAPGTVIVHPGGKEPARRWPPERFAAVARELRGRGHPVVVTGTAAERPLASRVAGAAGLPPEAVLAGRTPLRDLCALVAGARLLIAADTGVAHLATAYGTPSVVIFGPVPPSRWGPPPGRPRHRVLHRGPDPRAVTVEEVIAAATG